MKRFEWLYHVWSNKVLRGIWEREPALQTIANHHRRRIECMYFGFPWSLR